MKRILVVWLMILVVAACSATGLQSTPQSVPSSANTGPGQASGTIAKQSALANQIRNMKIQLVAQNLHPTVQLTDGKYRSTSDPASPDYADVTLLPEPMAFGDLNGDGVDDAAVLLAENYGGTGTFVSLIAMLNVGGQPVQAGAYMLDDRPMISGLRVADQHIVLEGDIHGPNDPGCCASFPVLDTFGLTKSGLTLQRMVSKTPDEVQRSIIIESPAAGTQIAAGSIQVKGSCTISPFENALSYHVYDVMRNELTAGSVLVTAEPGSAGTFDVPIDLSVVPAGTLVRLEIADLSAADGSMLAMDSVELMIK